MLGKCGWVLVVVVVVAGILLKPSQRDTRSSLTFYDFPLTTIEGTPLATEHLRGKVVVVVNVASECGLTESNYRQLSELLDEYWARGLRVVLFPCNQFLGQEPGDPFQILQFGSKWNDKFLMTQKVDVNGAAQHPLWAWLKATAPGGFLGDDIKWNFTKFLLNRQGLPIARYGPIEEPNKMIEAIVKALNEKP
eukprot:TRINITY_DN8889_c0_g1_i1.p1 TRINITY_DN8889_c0_g1~~TRINITY_DN8889_c0_g1_i1.p1  ORF type:complete len:193 (-),score=32.57 TRINITY_DN8889_c0_g1_i1:46-624(-)